MSKKDDKENIAKKFKKYCIEELANRGFQPDKAEQIYDDSIVAELIISDANYVLHYNIEYWVDKMIENLNIK